MLPHLRHLPISTLTLHPHAAPAHDALLQLVRPAPTSLGAVVLQDHDLWMVVAGFGWLHAGLDELPVIQIETHPDRGWIEEIAWREVDLAMRTLSARPQARRRFVSTVSRQCPDALRTLFDLPASRDVTALRRRAGLRSEQPIDPVGVFETARAQLMARRQGDG